MYAMLIQGIRTTFNKLLGTCRGLAAASPLQFVVLLATISISTSWTLDQLFNSLGRPQADELVLLRHGAGAFIFMAVVAAPLAETLLLQQLPIVLTRRLGLSTEMQFASGSIPFALVHFTSGVATGVSAGVIGGVILCTAYLCLVPLGKAKAFVVTASVHSLHNLVFCLLYLRDADLVRW